MYNIAINLVEITWKDQVQQLYPHPADFNAYMGKILTWIGIISTFTSIFISGTIIRKFSWTTSAMISPLILLVTGVGFFFCFFFKDSSFANVAAMLGTSPLALCVFFGSLQNCLARSSKYTLFDATKEMAFIPLSKECKLKGKAAIDGVGSRLGKSGGSLMYQGLIVSLGTVALTAPYVAAILMVTISGWMVAVRALGRRFNEQTDTRQAPPAAQPATNP